jgi:toxin ParE1/3/4
MAYKLSAKAEADLRDIYLSGYEAFGRIQAERYFAELEEAFEFLASYPRAARERTEITPPVRVHRCKSHLIIYLIDKGEALILRVRHGREEWEAQL